MLQYIVLGLFAPAELFHVFPCLSFVQPDHMRGLFHHIVKPLTSPNSPPRCNRPSHTIPLHLNTPFFIYRSSSVTEAPLDSLPIYQIPGKIAYFFLLYLSPNSFLYLLSFFHAHTPICPTAKMINTTVLKLQFTSATPIHATASNM
jgi:hypothetical protein